MYCNGGNHGDDYDHYYGDEDDDDGGGGDSMTIELELILSQMAHKPVLRG